MKLLRTRVSVAAMVILMGVCAQIAEAQQVKEPETITIFEDEVEDGPMSLSERVFEVDAVIRCRVESGRVKASRKAVRPGVDPKYGLDVFTEQIVSVLEVIKADERLPKDGGRLVIAQPVGETVVNGVRVRRDTTFKQFAPGEEYVLFLSWNPSRQLFSVLPSDTFGLKDAQVVPKGPAAYATRETGSTETDFLTRLRGTKALPRQP